MQKLVTKGSKFQSDTDPDRQLQAEKEGIARPKGEHRARCEHGMKPEGSSGATAPRLGLEGAKMDQNPPR